MHTSAPQCSALLLKRLRAEQWHHLILQLLWPLPRELQPALLWFLRGALPGLSAPSATQTTPADMLGKAINEVSRAVMMFEVVIF